MTTVLVLESDALSRLHYLRALSGIPGLSVIATSSDSETDTLLGAMEPDIVLLGAGALDKGRLLRCLERNATLEPRVVTIVGPGDDPAEILSSVGGIAVSLRKPIASEELRFTVQSLLAEVGRGLSFTLADYLHLACISSRSLRLSVVSRGDSGTVTVDRGEIWSASFGEHTGFVALAKAVLDGSGQVAIRPPLTQLPPRELAGEWSILLGEARRFGDEVKPGTRSSVLTEADLNFSDVLAERSASLSDLPTVPVASGRRPVGFTVPDAPHVDPRLARGVVAVIEQQYETALRLFEAVFAEEPESTALRRRIARLQHLCQQVKAGSA